MKKKGTNSLKRHPFSRILIRRGEKKMSIGWKYTKKKTIRFDCSNANFGACIWLGLFTYIQLCMYTYVYEKINKHKIDVMVVCTEREAVYQCKHIDAYVCSYIHKHKHPHRFFFFSTFSCLCINQHKKIEVL